MKSIRHAVRSIDCLSGQCGEGWKKKLSKIKKEEKHHTDHWVGYMLVRAVEVVKILSA